MKKCPRCQLVYHMDERARCLYCDSILLTTDRQEENKKPPALMAGFSLAQVIVQKIFVGWTAENHARSQYLIGNYFKIRTFSFMYAFSRNEYKMGRTYKRALIQPLSVYSLFMLPWVAYNVLDTIFFRLTYNTYCEKCQCKFIRYAGQKEHNPNECEYNREYTAVVNDIVSGQIAETESKLKWLAAKKIESGKKSAYRDLCLGEKGWQAVWDVMCIWLSICLVVITLVVGLFPRAIKVITGVSGEMESVYDEENTK
ncbi:MAG: hypothetical protein WC450_03085 [Candidatus Omnitrophota bacterium]